MASAANLHGRFKHAGSVHRFGPIRANGKGRRRKSEMDRLALTVST
jgi:hypothetical protein